MTETSESMAAVEVAGPTRDESREPAAAQDELRGRSGRQYMLSLKSAFVTALAKAERAAAGDLSSAPRPDPGVVAELKAIFARYEGPKADWGAPDVWDDAFSAERLMVDLYDDDALGVELARRTLDMRTLNTSLAEFYSARIQAPAPDSPSLATEQVRLNRALLSRLTRDLQWEYNQQDLKRRYSHQAQKRVVYTFIGALGVFAVVMFLTFHFVQLTAAEATGAPTPAPPAAAEDQQ